MGIAIKNKAHKKDGLKNSMRAKIKGFYERNNLS